MRVWIVPASLLMLLALSVCAGAGGMPVSAGATGSGEMQIGNRQEVAVAGLSKGLVPSVEEKKRTPKSEPDKKKEESKSSSDEDEDSSCMESIFEAMLMDMCSGDDEEEVQIAPMAPAPVVPVQPAPVEFLPYKGVISPPDPTVLEVEAWEVAGGAGTQGRVVFMLPRGSEVDVTQAQVVDGVGWLWVHWAEAPPEAEAAYGWVLEHYVEGVVGGTGLAVEESVVSRPAVSPPAWQLNTDLAVAFLTHDHVELEYDKVGYHAGVCGMGAVASWFYIGGRIDWTHSEGDPNYLYTTVYEEGEAAIDSLVDDPLASKVDIISVTVPVGHSVVTSDGAHFSWSIGPGIYWVRESADIEFEEMDDDSVVRRGLRTDSMSRLRFGGELRASIGGCVGGVMTIGVSSGIAMISWNPKQSESLGLDWLDAHYFATYYAGLTIGYLSQ